MLEARKNASQESLATQADKYGVAPSTMRRAVLGFTYKTV